MFESQLMSSCFLHFPGCEKIKTRSERQFQQQRKFPYFKYPFHCTVEDLPASLKLEVVLD